MVNKRELLDRFGDTEFLVTLWRKAETEVPGRLAELQGLLAASPVYDRELLAQRLHKLRGLVANFLTGDSAIPALVKCEALVEQKDYSALPTQWEAFCAALHEETTALNSWLAENSG